MKRTSITDLESLDAAILQLKEHSGKLETQLDDNFDYLQHNYSSLIKQSLFGNITRLAVASGILKTVLNSDRIQNSIPLLIEKLAERLLDWGETLWHKFADKKASD